MPVRKTVAKKATTKTAAKKPTTKNVSTEKVAEVKKPTVVVETKKTDRCECGDHCNCGDSCTCCCKCTMKLIILILIVVNLILSVIICCRWCKTNWKSAWDLEALKVWWQENLEKLRDNRYWSQDYIDWQKAQIQAYLDQLWID